MLNAALAVAVIAAVTIAAPEANARHVTVQDVAPGIAQTWAPDQWERGLPPREVRRTYRRALYHAANRRHRRAMRQWWRGRARVFLEHRAEMRAEAAEQARIEALTPYDCGGGVRSAIPCYIPYCESRYDWDAYNPSSGATGFYQFLPSSYARWCTTCDWSREDQHRAAGDYYAAAGGAPWVCA